MEEILIKKVEAGIRAIKLGTKSPKEAGIGAFLNQLKGINEPMYDELMGKYKEVIKGK